MHFHAKSPFLDLRIKRVTERIFKLTKQFHFDFGLFLQQRTTTFEYHQQMYKSNFFNILDLQKKSFIT